MDTDSVNWFSFVGLGRGCGDGGDDDMVSLFLLQGGVTVVYMWYSAAFRRRSKPENGSGLLVAIVVCE